MHTQSISKYFGTENFPEKRSIKVEDLGDVPDGPDCDGHATERYGPPFDMPCGISNPINTEVTKVNPHIIFFLEVRSLSLVETVSVPRTFPFLCGWRMLAVFCEAADEQALFVHQCLDHFAQHGLDRPSQDLWMWCFLLVSGTLRQLVWLSRAICGELQLGMACRSLSLRKTPSSQMGICAFLSDSAH